jgi:hypothetical protein
MNFPEAIKQLFCFHDFFEIAKKEIEKTIFNNQQVKKVGYLGTRKVKAKNVCVKCGKTVYKEREERIELRKL